MTRQLWESLRPLDHNPCLDFYSRQIIPKLTELANFQVPGAKMSYTKKFFLFLFCLGLGISAQATISYPPDVNPYKNLEKRISNLSSKQKTELLTKIYAFMIRREEVQPTAISSLETPEVDNWLNQILWGTSYAGAIAATAQEVEDCVKMGPRRVQNVLYPRACIFAGNIICTRESGVRPRCNQDFIHQYRPDLLCTNGQTKCNPDVFMKCNNDERVADDCVDVNALKRRDSRNPKGPAITLACIGGRDEATMRAKAEQVSKCANYDKVADVLKNILQFCGTLKNRSGKGYDKSDFAGNDQDCADLEKYIGMIAKRPESTPAPKEDVCGPDDKHKMLCEGQDTASLCGAISYRANTKKEDDCINVAIEQAMSGAKENTRFCKDSKKQDFTIRNQKLNPGRGLNWIHRPAKNFSWNDNTKIGRVRTTGPDGDPNFNYELTDSEGFVDLCFDDTTGEFRESDYFRNYIDKVVKDEKQREVVKDRMVKCRERNRAEMLRQGFDLSKVRNAKEAEQMYRKASSKWVMVKVKDVKNQHMAVRMTTGHGKINGNGTAEPVCTPDRPCTEGTFACMRANKKNEFKDVAEYFTLYTDRQDGKDYGDLQFIETGTYQTTKTVRGGRGQPDRVVDDFKKFPVYAEIYDVNETEPFLRLSQPVELKIGHWYTLGKDVRESVVYNGTENLCPNEITSYRSRNRFMAKMKADGSVENYYVCDSEDGNEYAPWMYFSSNGNMSNDGSTVAIKGLKGWDDRTASEQVLDISYNKDAPGNCVVKWSGSDTPAILVAGRQPVTPRRSIKDINRTTQSVEPQKDAK